MKVSKEQLKKIIQEELSAAIQEGELEEGFLDKLLGKSSSFGGFISDQDVKEKVRLAVNSLTDLIRTASKQENPRLADKAAELKRGAMELSSMSVPKGPRMIDSSKISPETLNNLRSDLLSGRPKTSMQTLRSLYKKIFGKQAPNVDRKTLIDIILREIEDNKGIEQIDGTKFTGNLKVREPTGSGAPLKPIRLKQEGSRK